MGSVQDQYSHFLDDQREFFDQLIVEDWSTYFSADWDYVRNFEVRQLFTCIGVPGRILDIGCGCGYHDYVMAEYEAVRQVVAIDYSVESIRRAEEHYGHPKVKRLVADVFELDEDTDFDLVTSFQVLEHLAQPERFMRRCYELARPGGVVAVFTPNRLRLQNRLRLALGKEPLQGDVMHFREFSASELIDVGKQAGLEFYKLFGYGFDVTLKGMRIPLNVRIRVWLGRLLPTLAQNQAAIFKKP